MLYGLKGERAVMVELLRRVADGELPIAALTNGGVTTKETQSTISQRTEALV